MESLGELVKIWRKASGLTQLELAQRVGIAYQKIQQLESGKTKQPRYMAALARAMGTSADALLALQMPPKLGESSAGMHYTPAPLKAPSLQEAQQLTAEERQFIEDLNALLPEERARYRKEVSERATLMRKHAEHLFRAVKPSRASPIPDEISEHMVPPPAPRISAQAEPAAPIEPRDTLLPPPAPVQRGRRAK